MNTTEKDFEATVEASLLRDPFASPTSQAVTPLADAQAGVYVSGGYQRREPVDYDRAACLIPKDVLNFVCATQPKEWEKMLAQHGGEAKATLLKRLASEIQRHGTLHVLRKGVKANGCKFRLAYFKPSSGLNEAAQKLYLGNQFSVVRQLAYSEKNDKSLDLGIFLNGLAATEIVQTLLGWVDAPSAKAMIEASVHLPKRGRRWIATYRDGSGHQFWKSTGQTDRQAALIVAQALEKAARRAQAEHGEQEKVVVRARPGGGGLTQQEVALRLGMSARGVRAVERRALEKLKRHPALRALWRELVREDAYVYNGPGAIRRRDHRRLRFGADVGEAAGIGPD